MKRTLILIVILSLSPLVVFAANFSMDSRTQGSAGAGVASASFLSAGFYNPALVAVSIKRKKYGVLFPTLGVRYRDENDLIDDLEDFSGKFSRFTSNTSNAANTAAALSKLQNKQAIVAGGIAGSAGIAGDHFSGVFFISAFTEGVALSEIDTSDITAISAGTTTTPTSRARVVGAGVIDIGLSIGKQFKIANLPIAVGITPKIQQIYTYHQQVSVLNFDISDWTNISNRTDKSTFNLDIGALWQQGRLNVGLVGKNLIAKKVMSLRKSETFDYEINPFFTLGTAWKTRGFIFSADLDLNKLERVEALTNVEINDDTQFLRLGSEYQLSEKIQFRAGFIHDLENNLDDSLTLGLGVGIDELARVDAALELIDKNSYGASIQLSFSL